MGAQSKDYDESDDIVNIRGIEDYTMPKSEKEFHLVSSEDESESESECEEGSERSKSATETESSSSESD